MDKSWILIDGTTGLHVSWYFWLRALDEVNRSARYGSPFGLLLLEAEPPRGESTRILDDAIACVPAAIRGTDLGGLLGAARAGVVLPQQGVEAANTAADRIMERLAKSSPEGVVWHQRLLCYPGDAAEISNMLTSGWSDRRMGGEAPALAEPA